MMKPRYWLSLAALVAASAAVPMPVVHVGRGIN